MSLTNKIEKGWQIIRHVWDDEKEQGKVWLARNADLDGDGTLSKIERPFDVSSFAEIAELYNIQTDSDKADLKAAKKADKQRKKIKADLEKLLAK